MSARRFLVKVPEITALFWVVKVLTTAFGESASDFLVTAMNPVIGVIIGFLLFVAAIYIQFRAKRYIAWVYWFAVAMVAVFGTMAADALHVGLGVSYVVSTTFYAFVLIIIFALWYKTEKTLSIHSIYTFRREVFYWATVVTTFALGTAAGDLTAANLGLGYFVSGILFAAFIIAVTVIHYIAKAIANAEHIRFRNEVIAFWFAYVLTRPLGASFADWFGKAKQYTGLGWGDGHVSIVLGVLIILLVGYLAFTGLDQPKNPQIENS